MLAATRTGLTEEPYYLDEGSLRFLYILIV